MDSLLEKDKSYVWHPFTQMAIAPDPLVITRAKDAVLYSEDGKSYLDVNSSWWVNVHGHANEHIRKAINDQFIKVDHCIFAGATHEKAIELSERIIKKLPNNFQKVFFSDDGSTSVEVAIKMAFQYWSNKNRLEKKRILAMEGAYHGDTFGAMSVGQRGYFNEPFEHFFFDVDFIEFPDKKNEANILNKAESLFQTGEFAGMIIEPLIQGSSGMRMYSAEFLDELTGLAKKHGVLVIFDEVMTAWGRTGKLFAMEHCNNIPDIVCLSKGLTGGVLPLGLTVSTQEIFDAFLSEDRLKALLHGHSFTGNALACAAACASLDIFERDETLQNIQRITSRHKVYADSITENQMVKEVRQLGTILAIEIETGEGSGYFSSIRDEVYNFFIERGILLRPLGNIYFFNPPYCISDEQLSAVYSASDELLRNLKDKRELN